MFFKDFVSVKRQKIKRGASQTYDTPPFDLMILCLIIHTLPTFFERFQPHKSKYFAIFIVSKSIMYENRQHTMFITRQAHAPHLGVKMKMLQISADTNNRFNQFPLLQKALTKL